ncbi:hypothetical protein NAC44_19845 [Allorhizobium sp. BGMRC 0089]|uniref:hypothetical protein n=1 Tax=Allorhizobium sonneratiae TaxID=2934936 RepID=UPI0020341A60|nr:hypothetical protein [Allorhizobium sonneratiae]MCM2294586.1 hypothetical protein [Allorhizobium sonneratiae]
MRQTKDLSASIGFHHIWRPTDGIRTDTRQSRFSAAVVNSRVPIWLAVHRYPGQNMGGRRKFHVQLYKYLRHDR